MVHRFSMKRAAIVTLVIMLAVVLAGALYIFFLDESDAQRRNQTPAATALLIDEPEKSYTDTDGNEVDIGSEFGGVIVVLSWASWCPQCVQDISMLDEVAKEFQNQPVTFLAINRAEDTDTAKRFLGTFTTPSFVKIIIDPSDHFYSRSQGYAMPETTVYSKDGEVLLAQKGVTIKDELKASIEEALKK